MENKGDKSKRWAFLKRGTDFRKISLFSLKKGSLFRKCGSLPKKRGLFLREMVIFWLESTTSRHFDFSNNEKFSIFSQF